MCHCIVCVSLLFTHVTTHVQCMRVPLYGSSCLPLCTAAIHYRSAFEEECQCRKRDIQFLQVGCVPTSQPAQPTTVLMVTQLPTNDYLHTPYSYFSLKYSSCCICISHHHGNHRLTNHYQLRAHVAVKYITLDLCDIYQYSTGHIVILHRSSSKAHQVGFTCVSVGLSLPLIVPVLSRGGARGKCLPEAVTSRWVLQNDAMAHAVCM